MSDLEALLENVALESFAAYDDTYVPILEVLRRKLLPLLEAGEAMRKWKPAYEDGQAWDAAKQSALEGK